LGWTPSLSTETLFCRRPVLNPFVAINCSGPGVFGVISPLEPWQISCTSADKYRGDHAVLLNRSLG
jgi:hypothetical protein